MRKTIIRFIVSVGVIVLIVAIVRYAQSPHDNRQQQVQEEFRSLSSRTGDAYLQARERILAQGQESLPVLENAIEEGRTWQDRLLAEILVARIKNPKVFEQVETIVNEAKQWGTHADPNRVSTLFFQSEFVEMDENPVLPALELIMFVKDRPSILLNMMGALVTLHRKDERLVRPVTAMLDTPELQFGAVLLIQSLRSAELAPKLVALYQESADSKMKKRIARALGVIGDERVRESIRELAETESDETLKHELNEAYRMIQEREKSENNSQ